MRIEKDNIESGYHVFNPSQSEQNSSFIDAIRDPHQKTPNILLSNRETTVNPNMDSIDKIGSLFHRSIS